MNADRIKYEDQAPNNRRVGPGRTVRGLILGALILLLLSALTGCFGVDDPQPYYGKVVVPRVQQFRWSDGGLPQTFDPAFAAAPPDTDAVRALFEGLTDYDPKTLTAVPAVATRWESSGDGRTWTFYLRDDAHWSNGEKVTAHDFVKSWERTIKIGPLAPHTELLNNIEGATVPTKPAEKSQNNAAPALTRRFGAEAVDDHVLRVRLQSGDANFPALVAHPVFRPVKVPESEPTKRLAATNLISNGAFQLAKSDNQSVLLERAKTYWDGASVSLDRVEFVNSANAEDALAAYRSGEIDAVSSAPFEPLALKLLAPYKDFRRSTFGALTYYSFNTTRAPFDDVRVREALAISINRERVSRDDLGGATEPASKFLPEVTPIDRPVVDNSELLQEDVRKAKALLAEAGFPNGENFPEVRLLINRNDQQRVVAQSIAQMWHSALNIETEIIIKNWDEYEAIVKAGDYDVVRRGMVMQTTDELTNLRLLFPPEPRPEAAQPQDSPKAREAPKFYERPADIPEVESETLALKELRAMPIYFASSYALVKPYVSGFDANLLGLPSLKKTRIETGWTEGEP